METLLGLFEAASWIGDVLSRSSEKDAELSSLAVTVQSVTESVKCFSSSLPDEDKAYVFNSNQVFPELARVLNSAKEVLMKFTLSIQNGVQAKPDKSSGFRGMLTSSMKQGSRTLQDGLEAISSKVGRASDLLRLPEDELGLIRQANSDIKNLLPQLSLAIAAVSLRGSKRHAENSLESQAQRQKTLGDNAGLDASVEGVPAPETEAKRPLVNLKLVSDASYFQDLELPRMTTQDLRPITAVSSASLESESSPGEHQRPTCRLVLGRQELVNKKVTCEVPTPKTPMALTKFVSRDFMQLDIPETVAPTQGTIEMATLALGFWEDSQETAESATVATVSGLSSLGLYVRRHRESRWQFHAKQKKVEIMEGDRVALVLESPPGSMKWLPGEGKDLEGDEAVCILGCELQRP
ncbi:unnamed protein product [Durusdinium trenchii]|uniref:Uncharacterized protein n=2 Tax=Durusdinium trenchii TaxID=1381693 RepID=A0ABP0HLB8_9DINO